MKKSLIALAATLLATAALAESVAYVSYARVVSAVPIHAQERVEVPGYCHDQHGSNTSGGGALIGGVLGGVVGNRFGDGSGRAAATAIGAVAGAVMGNKVEADRQGRQPDCGRRAYYEERLVGYDVTYEFGGYRGRTRTTEFPGREIPVEVSVSPVTPYRSR